MSNHATRRSIRLELEPLESRCTPAGTVTGSLRHGVWRLTGDDLDNAITVDSKAGKGAFKVTVPFPSTTAVAGITSPTGVRKIVFDMKGGADSVEVNGGRLTSMVFNGGDGNNLFAAERFSLAAGLKVINGVGSGIGSDTGFDETYLQNCRIAGNVNVNNGAGGSGFYMQTLSSAFGFNHVGGNVTMTNGAGDDRIRIVDTDVDGNITAHNGRSAGANAGYFQIQNGRQAGRRAMIGGSITVSFQDGNVLGNAISDAVVRGNVLFNNGTGSSNNYFSGEQTTLPTIVQGRLKIVGTGATLVSIGREGTKTGLAVGQDLVINVQAPGELTLKASRLTVHGQTRIT